MALPPDVEVLALPPHHRPSSARTALWEKRIALEEQLGLRFGSELDFRSWYDWAFARMCTLLIRAAGLHGRGRRNTYDFELARFDLKYPDLPEALAGLRILHLSDFHFPRFDPKFADAVVELVRPLEADLCLLTGDYRFGYFGPSNHVYPAMARIVDALQPRYGTFGSLGNHDLGEMVAPLEAAGVRMLVNEGVGWKIGAADLWIGGVDDAHRFATASVAEAREGAREGAFKVLLAHTPENAEEAAANGFDLCLCGHTHGGQISFPIYGPPMLNARCPKDFKIGPWRCGQMQGYTTRGLGTTDIPFRFNCRPEAVLLTLQKS